LWRKPDEEPVVASAMTMMPDEGIVSDDFTRKETYTKPRTITLDTKYDGAPKIQVWTGYAVNVISDTGTRKVVEGPATVNLKYDEFLEAMELSTGTPKSPDKKIKTVYLRVKNNKVSDVVQAETKDLCNVQILLSYRVSFTGERVFWFDVEDYVGFLTDHMRSLLRNLVKQHGVEDFYNDSINIIRDAILGKASEEGRIGRLFTENGMHITDVEVLNVKLGDNQIANLLQDAEIEAVHQNLKIAKRQRDLDFTKENERIKRESSTAVAETTIHDLSETMTIIEKQEERDLRDVDHTHKVVTAKKQAELEEQEVLDAIQEKVLARELAKDEQELLVDRKTQDLELENLKTKVQAFVDQASAIQPELTAALQTLGDQFLTGKLTENMSVQAILGGKSVVEVLRKLLDGTVLGKRLEGDLWDELKKLDPDDE
jgi:major vault protein